jgi:hypothetical protein
MNMTGLFERKYCNLKIDTYLSLVDISRPMIPHIIANSIGWVTWVLRPKCSNLDDEGQIGLEGYEDPI